MSIEFISSLLSIIAIDIILGGDNAVVIAMATRNLAVHQRNKAIFFGTGLAIVVRVILTIIAVYLLKIPYLQLVGGLLLIYIAYSLLVEEHSSGNEIKASTSLFAAIQTIVFADLVMGIDNVVGIAGAAHGNIILVMTGFLISVPIIVGGSKIILTFMEKYPSIVYIGSGILALTAGKMITNDKSLSFLVNNHPSITYVVPAIIIIFVVGSGYLRKNKSNT